jgi:predicted dinucleotide-binding enzyme
MQIGIIGAGNIGSALTRRLTGLGHSIAVANARDPGTLSGLAAETGATAVWAADAARDAEIVIVAIPEKNVPQLPRDFLRSARRGAAVIDTGNYYPKERDGRITPIESGLPESLWVAGQLEYPVSKVFNNIIAPHILQLGRPPETPGRIALPVAGDDAGAKEVVLALVEALGFDPVDAGGLDESWRQQPGTPVYATDLDASGVRKALDAASPVRSAAFRA